MSDVSVIGCGNMGSALIRALADAGREVTIWNRTREKAEALAGPQVTVASSVGGALEASPVALVSITNYTATREVLEDQEDYLSETTLVQLTRGTPGAARDLEEQVRSDGEAYVDGAVLGYPSAVGTEELLILYSGDRETFAATRPLLEDLGGTAMHVGEDAGTASVLEVAAFGPAMLMAVGIWQGAKICEIEGVPFETFAELVKGIVPAVAEDSLRKAAAPDFATDPEKIEGTVKQMADGATHAAEYFREVGVDPGMVEALQRIYQAGVEEGRGEHDMCCVAELHADHPELAAWNCGIKPTAFCRNPSHVMNHYSPTPSTRLNWAVRATLIALLLACTSWGWVPAPSDAQPQDRAELVAALDSAAQAHAADSMVAGAAVAVVQRADTLLHEGYGQANLQFDVPMPRDAIFEVGSITKQFTAAAILQLAAKDSVQLNDAVTEYLPDFDTRGHRVTVRHLLHHTSGLRSYTNMAQFEGLGRQDLPRDTLLSLVEAEPFRFAPGTAMSYSNTGYFLLGRIIEETSGQSYESYLKDYLFGPAGMENSYYCDEEAAVERKAHGYQWSREGTLRRKDYLDHTWPFAAGSLCSSAEDLVAWNRALHGGEVLPDSLYREMTTPGRLADGTELRYGMGLANALVRGRRVIGHGGGIFGFLSESRYYPESGLIVVVLQNTSGPHLPLSLADSLARLALGPGEEQTSTPYDGTLSELTGRYVGPSRGDVTDLHVEVSGDTLLARVAGGEEADTLRHAKSLTWRHETDRYRFVRAGGQTIELRLDVVGGHYVLRRVGDR